jgi:hypothetical protein
MSAQPTVAAPAAGSRTRAKPCSHTVDRIREPWGNSADAGGGIVNISFDPTVSAGTVTLTTDDA